MCFICRAPHMKYRDMVLITNFYQRTIRTHARTLKAPKHHHRQNPFFTCFIWDFIFISAVIGFFFFVRIYRIDSDSDNDEKYNRKRCVTSHCYFYKLKNDNKIAANILWIIIHFRIHKNALDTYRHAERGRQAGVRLSRIHTCSHGYNWKYLQFSIRFFVCFQHFFFFCSFFDIKWRK